MLTNESFLPPLQDCIKTWRAFVGLMGLSVLIVIPKKSRFALKTIGAISPGITAFTADDGSMILPVPL